MLINASLRNLACSHDVYNNSYTLIAMFVLDCFSFWIKHFVCDVSMLWCICIQPSIDHIYKASQAYFFQNYISIFNNIQTKRIENRKNGHVLFCCVVLLLCDSGTFLPICYLGCALAIESEQTHIFVYANIIVVRFKWMIILRFQCLALSADNSYIHTWSKE